MSDDTEMYDPNDPTPSDDEYDPRYPTPSDDEYDPRYPTPSDDEYDPRYPTPSDDEYDPRYPTPSDDVEMYDPNDPTPSDDEGDGTAAQQPAPQAFDYSAHYGELNPNSDRVQGFDNDQYLWHSSRPGCSVEPGTGQFIDSGGTPTGEYLFQANLLTRTPLDFGDSFYLVPVGPDRYDANSYAADGRARGSVFVPWHHIMQHSYAHIDSLAIKEAHTFWPPGTTEAQILNALVADLNAGGQSIVWTDNTRIKTFFPRNAASASDRYSPDQLTDLGEAVLRW